MVTTCKRKESRRRLDSEMSLMEAVAMVTYGAQEFKAKVSEKLTPAEGAAAADGKKPLSALRGSLPNLPDATDEDFVEAKKIWEPRIPDDL